MNRKVQEYEALKKELKGIYEANCKGVSIYSTIYSNTFSKDFSRKRFINWHFAACIVCARQSPNVSLIIQNKPLLNYTRLWLETVFKLQ